MEQKKNSELSLGCITAYLEQVIESDRNVDALLGDESSIKALDTLQTRYNLLDKDSSIATTTIPKQSCMQDNHFLKENPDFFVHHFFFYENDINQKKTRQKLMKHLNDCYWCFCEYSNFFKDYFRTLETLRAK